MRRSEKKHTFFEALREAVKPLGSMKPGEVHVLSINANYGHYEITIGPRGVGNSRGADRCVIEIDGKIHHLFISPHTVRAIPSKHQVKENMKDTIIANNLTVHIVDPMGDGKHVKLNGNGDNGIHFKDVINMAGPVGEKIIAEAEHSKQMSMAAYRLIQRDILHALKEKKELH